MKLQVRQYKSAVTFLADCEKFLLQNEPGNNLILGLAYALRDQRLDCDNPLFVSVCTSTEPVLSEAEGLSVTEGPEMILCALQTPPRGIILAGSPSTSLRVTDEIHPQAWEAIDTLTSFLHEEWPRVAEVFAPEDLVWPFADCWTRIWNYGVKVKAEHHISALEKVAFPPIAQGSFRAAKQTDARLLTHWFRDFHIESLNQEIPDKVAEDFIIDHIVSGEIFVWTDADGAVVSMAMSTRETPQTAVINYVYTPPELRNRGYAANCVASLSQSRLDKGKKTCVLFIDKENPVSNSIYQKMGFAPCGSFFLLSFYPLES